MNQIDFSKPGTYAGIGSRETPSDVLALMTRIAMKLDGMGWTLRSGGADGADYAFARGATYKEIFVPWPRFNDCITQFSSPTDEAKHIAMQFHPNWRNIYDAVQKLHARNVHQILGPDCNSPSTFVLCWTPDGSIGQTTKKTGGTGQALRIAHAYSIPIFNLRREDHRAEWERFAS